jgi:hypothetical protein
MLFKLFYKNNKTTTTTNTPSYDSTHKNNQNKCNQMVHNCTQHNNSTHNNGTVVNIPIDNNYIDNTYDADLSQPNDFEQRTEYNAPTNYELTKPEDGHINVPNKYYTECEDYYDNEQLYMNF